MAALHGVAGPIGWPPASGPDIIAPIPGNAGANAAAQLVGSDDAGRPGQAAGIENAGIGNAGIGNAGIGYAGIANAGIGNAGIGNAGIGNAGIGKPQNFATLSNGLSTGRRYHERRRVADLVPGAERGALTPASTAWVNTDAQIEMVWVAISVIAWPATAIASPI